MAKLVREGDFLGPDFVRGLALQENNYVVKNKNVATLAAFPGGFHPLTNEYTMTLYGEGFGVTSDGRYTGVVKGFTAVDQNGNAWHVTGYDVPLNTVNTAATMQNFIENLLIPIRWNYEGNDTPDIFIGGSFADTLKGFGGPDTFEGLGGGDTILGGRGPDTLHGQAGNDLIRGQGGADTVTGGTGADKIYGGRADDDLTGEGDTDLILGGRGRDLIQGGDAGDTLGGGRGADQIFGGTGPDTIRGGKGDDFIDGGDQGDRILGGSDDDLLLGEGGADEIGGGRGKDLIDGGDDTDVVLGGRGNDIVQGGIDPDFIVGGRGNDILAGNTSSTVEYDQAPDTFIFEGRFGDDIITDFEINWDGIRLLKIDPSDVSVTDVGSDVLIEVDHLGTHTILVQGVAGQFDANVDIVYG